MACRPLALLSIALAAPACTRGNTPDADVGAPAPADAAPTLSARTEAGAPNLAPGESSSAAAPPAPSTPAAVASRAPDGAASFCRTVRAPVQLAPHGAAALAARDDRSLDVVLNDDGHPHLLAFGSDAASGSTEPPDEHATANALRLPCAVAGEFAYCPDRSGAVHRARFNGEGDRVVANARAGTHVSAAVLAGAHTALGYLASRQTSEGWVSEAWLAVDDDVPLRVSEDGSGATAIEIASRGASLLAVAVDARSALTALHARPVAYAHGAHVGEDSVVFVGGPGDRRTAAALALPPSGPGWALLPIARDVNDFGLAVVRIEEPPRVDEPVAWSAYPNGLDPAPVAAAIHGSRTWVARVRPESADPSAQRVLELGEIEPAAAGGPADAAVGTGSFVPREILPTAGAPSHVALAFDPRGELWLSWLDPSGSWLERLACR
jgi:hypothetical protein